MSSFIKIQEENLKKIIEECGYKIEKVDLVVSSRKDLGEYQFNGVMSLAKKLKRNPREIAIEISEKLKEDSSFVNVNVAGPGFINISFAAEDLISYMNKISNDIEMNIDKMTKKKVVIDYGGPNVAKTLHVGHLRSANIGEAIKRLAKTLGYDVYLPQEEGGLASELINESNKLQINKQIFESDIEGIKSCDILLFLLDGRVPDEGACVELGMAYAWNKKCVGYKTDTRALDITGDDNLFIEGCFDFKIARTLNELELLLKES